MDNDMAFKTGDRVRLITLPPYFKTAEPIPMLRPPNVVQLDEEGVVMGRDPGDFWRVRFSRGAYLVDRKYLGPAEKV
ncbi:regulatory protein SipA [Altericista sp. CCNU0014]|uniref:regulatory protein SipA n=1 Tax=Altericista sp. CCNU0014 TaxID=3082949 RepID=UPI00384E9D84